MYVSFISLGLPVYSLIFDVPETKIAEFASSVDHDEVAHNDTICHVVF